MMTDQPDESSNQQTSNQELPRPINTEISLSDDTQTVRPTLGQLALGGALLLSDRVSTGLEVPHTTVEVPSRTLESVLRPVAEWEPAETTFDQARYVAIGMAKDLRRQAGSGSRGFYQSTDALGKAIDRTTRPIRRSRLMRPIRSRFSRYQAQGEAMVNRWSEIGRNEETQSRAIAEASLGTFVQRSVTDLTQSEHVQVLVQQVVASQGTSIVEEIIEEIRERVVTLDILFARRTRRSSRVPESPPFRPAYLQSRPIFAHISQIDRTMAGEYAGTLSRLLGFLVDVVLLALVLSLTTTFINAFVNLFNINDIIARFTTISDLTGEILAATAGLVTIILVSAYGVLSWTLSGQTIGDLLLGVRVVRTDGNRVALSRALLRIIGAYLSGIVFFLGFFWAVGDRRHQGWHDKLADTVVVYDWPAVPDELFLREELDVTGVLPQQQHPPVIQPRD